jgi:uncharacterized damage-inducible protein DinB
MSAFFDDLFDRFHELHTDLGKTIDGLPIEALDWVAGPDMSSISIMVVHLAGAERYWIGAVALGESTDRVREQEFEVKDLSPDELRTRLTEADEYARGALSRFSLTDLEETRRSPRNEKTFRVGWCLMHALEHSALHLGQVQLTRQLWEQNRSGESRQS